MLRMDHVGVVVDDLEAAVGFFASLGFERDGGTTVEGEAVDAINGLSGVRSEVVMLRTPDRSGCVEVCKYHSPVDERPAGAEPANRLGLRHLTFEIGELTAVVERLRGDGFGLVGEIREFGGTYRLCYVRGPEGIIVELAENVRPGDR